MEMPQWERVITNFFPLLDRCWEECAKLSSDNLFFKCYGYPIFLPLFSWEPLIGGSIRCGYFIVSLFNLFT